MKRVAVRFDDHELAACWGTRLTALDPADPRGSNYPYLIEDETYAKIRETNPRAPALYVVPADAHVRLYHGVRAVGVYCGHSRAIEELADGTVSHGPVRYVDGYATAYCPHSQEWEPLA